MKKDTLIKDQIKILEKTEESAAIATITLAFSADPLNRWVLPEAEQFLSVFPKTVAFFGGNAFNHSTAFRTTDYTGVALWLPPGVEPDTENLIYLVENYIREEIRENIFSIFEQMDHFHPKEPCWYLPLIGVDPCNQKKGQGSRLLQHALNIIDKQQMPAYLESSTVRNISLYEKFGFKVIGEIRAGDSPTLYPMLRDAVQK